MSDLINREDLIDWLTSGIIRLKGIYGDLGGAVSGVREMVKVMPSEEPEQKKGMDSDSSALPVMTMRSAAASNWE